MDMPQDLRHLLSEDPLREIPPRECQGESFPAHRSDLDRLLYFDGLGLEFVIDRKWEEDGVKFHSHVEITTAGHTTNGVTVYNPDSQWWKGGKHLFLLLTRHVIDDEVVKDDRHVEHNMILLRSVGPQLYERADFLKLWIPAKKLSILRGMGLHRLSGALI
jgi:hypothetical protein